ncbi:hypothetical protein [Chryseobacterium cheonjiense]|uniref:Uncharacterized protein n=1 Tax=Chryseobacterium cheonjiense TaxID=2728845 RepID=A0A7Y0A742_9FLAO|nr:hypothetical protein [Chryseobacterium cheonjiense]NML57706.1 hypothetical protein [Chryseobacterium cheonjiense]
MTKSVKKAKNNEKLEDSEVGTVINFSADGEQHKLWITTKGNSVEVMVASTTMSVSDRLKKWESEMHALPKEEQARAKALLSEAKSQYLETSQDARETDKALDKAKKQNASNDEVKKAEQLDDKVEDKENDSLILITNGIAALLNNNEYPNLKIKLHSMQETIGENVDNRRDSVINTVNSEIVDVANKVILYFNRTRYILGEDLGEQSLYNHQEPVILFKGFDASLAAYSIIPQEGTSTRSIIIGLAQGEFNGKLPGVL